MKRISFIGSVHFSVRINVDYLLALSPGMGAYYYFDASNFVNIGLGSAEVESGRGIGLCRAWNCACFETVVLKTGH